MEEIDEELLINLVAERPVIWAVHTQIYKNAKKREFSWKCISEIMNISADDLKTKWKSLKEKYVREKKSHKKASGSKRSNKAEWTFLEKLRFLDDTIAHRVHSTSMEIVVEADQYSPTDPVINLDELKGCEDTVEEVLEQVDLVNELTGKVETAATENSSSTSKSVNSTSATPKQVNLSQTTVNASQLDHLKPKTIRKRKADAVEEQLMLMMKDNNKKINSPSVREETDCDKMFLLSLYNDFHSLSKEAKTEAKISFIRKLDELKDY